MIIISFCDIFHLQTLLFGCIYFSRLFLKPFWQSQNYLNICYTIINWARNYPHNKVLVSSGTKFESGSISYVQSSRLKYFTFYNQIKNWKKIKMEDIYRFKKQVKDNLVKKWKINDFESAFVTIRFLQKDQFREETSY